MKPPKEEKTKAKKDELQKLHRQLDDLQKEKDELFEKLQRVGADYANFQKRASKQIAESIAYEKERIIKSLLPVLDSLEHTLQNTDSAENVDVMVKGIRIVYDQMLDILKSHNIEQMKALGEKFDPALHQAMMRRFQPEKQEDVIVEEFQKGYKLNGRVIRPGKVVVNKLQADREAQQQEPGEQKPERENNQ